MAQAALSITRRPSVRPGPPIFSKEESRRNNFQFSRIIAINKNNYREENPRSKGQRSLERKCKNRFSRISSSKVDRFTSNQDQNDERPAYLY